MSSALITVVEDDGDERTWKIRNAKVTLNRGSAIMDLTDGSLSELKMMICVSGLAQQLTLPKDDPIKAEVLSTMEDDRIIDAEVVDEIER